MMLAKRDLKRTLACSSISQIGFILVGTAMMCLLGEHNALAVDGTILHILNHSLIKMVLFPLAGIIHLSTHSFDLNEILLETEQGMLMVKGTDLHVNRLSVEKGEVDLSGNIDSIAYSSVTQAGKQGENLLSRLFK